MSSLNKEGVSAESDLSPVSAQSMIAAATSKLAFYSSLLNKSITSSSLSSTFKTTADITKRMNATSNFQLPTLADLCDDHVNSPARLSVVEPGLFFQFGTITRFCGQVQTVRCFESNPTVREVLSTPGHRQVLVVDGGGSKRVAIMGDQIAKLAVDNNWAGVIVNGCIRDSAIINQLDIGVRALGTHPVKSLKTYPGEKNAKCNFGGVEFVAGHWVYVDDDGILVSEKPLHENDDANRSSGEI